MIEDREKVLKVLPVGMVVYRRQYRRWFERKENGGSELMEEDFGCLGPSGIKIRDCEETGQIVCKFSDEDKEKHFDYCDITSDGLIVIGKLAPLNK